MTPREHHLKYCQVCKHRKMDLQKGLLCGLTNEFADFDDECPTFDKDMQEAEVRIKKVAGLEVEQVDETAKPYWKKLGQLVLALLSVGFLQALFIYFSAVNNWGINTILYLLFETLETLPLWFFIGWELNKIKDGLIAGAIVIVVSYIKFDFIEINSVILGLIPQAAGLLYLGYSTFTDKKQLFKFAGIGALIVLAYNAMFSFSFESALSVINDSVGGRPLKRFLWDFNFLSFLINTNSGGFTYISFHWLLNSIFYQAISFAFITLLFKRMLSKQKWSFYLVELNRRVSNGQMTLYVFIFYVSTFMLSFGLFEKVLTYTMLAGRGRNWSGKSLTAFNHLEQLIVIAGSLIILVFLVGLYRKILIEYYLDRYKAISWNFYFGQIPLIGIFVWMYNVATFKLPKGFNSEKIKLSALQDKGLPLLLILLTVLYMVGIWGVSRFDFGVFILFLISFILYYYYLYHESGIYAYTVVQLALLVVLVLIQLFGGDIPGGVLSYSFFWSLASIFLVYPAFHLQAFKIKILKNKPTDNDFSDKYETVD